MSALEFKVKDWYETDLVFAIIEQKFHNLKEFHDFIKSSVKEEKRDLSQFVDDQLKSLSKEQQEDFLEHHSEDFRRIDQVLKYSLDSFLIILCSLLEGEMLDLCHSVRRDKQKLTKQPILLEYDDIRERKPLDKFKTYMEKVLQIDLNLGKSSHWEEILLLKTIRNAIVHENGFLKIKKGRIQQKIKDGLVDIENKKECDGYICGVIRVKPEYTCRVFQQSKGFFAEIKLKIKSFLDDCSKHSNTHPQS